jgi:hypothetical protein
MKPQNDAIDLQVFDLLEGNLDAARSAEVQRLIAEDPEWAQSYRLMQMTYLRDADEDTIVFTGKENLYRKSYFIGNVRRFYAGIAAAIALLLVGGWFFFSLQNNSGKESASSARLLPESPKLLSPKIEKADNETETVAALYPAVPVPGKKWPSAGKPIRQTSPAAAMTGDSKEPQPEFETPYLPGLQRRNLVAPGQSGILPRVAEVHQFRYPDQRYVPMQQKRSLYYRAMNQGKEMLAWVSNPSLRLVRTEKEGRDGLMLRLQTQRMEIIATLID